jgi:hypothetical protein
MVEVFLGILIFFGGFACGFFIKGDIKITKKIINYYPEPEEYIQKPSITESTENPVFIEPSKSESTETPPNPPKEDSTLINAYSHVEDILSGKTTLESLKRGDK